MAVFLVCLLLRKRAYSLSQCQIFMLHVQSKLGHGNPAMQPTHDAWQDFVIYFRSFPTGPHPMPLSCAEWSDSASAK
ncbi:hypothetical protein [Rhodobacter calidifons]|uniref:Integrase-like protein n=1 Tax=Rhodobacter calidifons TaxID=2715277 RepID=A0ABX0G4H8_9RHOB|nr:hypothetical protein [Rhodobacter calidifons]NHB76104.1 hypothetical protein [Rhodobacter calidifons]